MFYTDWSRIRVGVLLSFLLFTMLYSAYQMTYSRNWGAPLDVVVYPIAADGKTGVQAYIDTLENSKFKSIDRWMSQQAKAHGLPNPHPIATRMGAQISDLPPAFPAKPEPWSILLWGLRMRLWSAVATPSDPQLSWRSVKIYVVYHKGEPNKALPHSLGLQKGLIGLVHAFATPTQTAQNNVVIAHELLHTVGASDKYDQYGSPLFPVGYANPVRSPLFPQRSAEIMAGRIPLTRYTSVMAHSLRSSTIGPVTAEEINWPE